MRPCLQFSSGGINRTTVRLRRARIFQTTEGNVKVSDIKVIVLLGSLRATSINRQLAELAVDEPVVALRAAATEADAALVVTPEYNGSIPGVLKNAIDWLSRPFGNGAP